MPSRGELGMTVLRSAARPAADLLHEARARERAACITEAVAAYEATIAVAEIAGEQAVLAEALRRLAVVRHRRAESVESEEHTSELQSRENLVCRLLLEKKNDRP